MSAETLAIVLGVLFVVIAGVCIAAGWLGPRPDMAVGFHRAFIDRDRDEQ